jgi:hypothetical protein
MSAKRKLLKSTLLAFTQAMSDMSVSENINELFIYRAKAHDHETVEDFKYHCGFSHEQAAVAFDNVLNYENY